MTQSRNKREGKFNPSTKMRGFPTGFDAWIKCPKPKRMTRKVRKAFDLACKGWEG